MRSRTEGKAAAFVHHLGDIYGPAFRALAAPADKCVDEDILQAQVPGQLKQGKEMPDGPV